MVRLLIVCVGLVVGCTQGSGTNPAPDAPPPACDATFTPDAELSEVATVAAERWSVALDRNICVAPGGYPITLTASGEDLPERACGYAWLGRQIKIDRDIVIAKSTVSYDGRNGCGTYAQTVLHEMGHILSGESRHASDGMMAPNSAHSDWPDSDAVAFVEQGRAFR
jgi:hypothetical protein